jgi:predicted dehydrogenase
MNSSKKVKIGVIGAGYWGKNHIRVLKELDLQEKCEFIGISDLDITKKQLAESLGIKYYQDYKSLIRNVDAIIIAAPAGQLFRISKYALKHSKHVLVEKPFSLNYKNGVELVELAEKNHLTIMVGHIFLYTPQINKIKQLVQDNKLGNVFYGYSQRLNLGIIRDDVNALWNFGPHDISIFLDLFNCLPSEVNATGLTYLQNRVEDVVFLNMRFPSGVFVSSHLSWIEPVKTRKVTLVGDKGMLVWDDASQDATIQIFDKGVVLPENWQELKSSNSFGEFKMKVRFGDQLIPYVASEEPLKNEILHFLECIKTGQNPRTGGEHALNVLKVLLAAQKSLEKNGQPQKIK